MNTKYKTPELSYFRVALEDFLSDGHPQLAGDERFKAARADEASLVYSRAVRDGCNPVQAEELAFDSLFEGLHFSKFDLVLGILWDEFNGIIPEEDAREKAGELLPVCEPVFAKYPLSEEFVYSSEYELMYTEIVGVIAIYLEEN